MSLFLVFVGVVSVDAEVILYPPGLNPGDQFRLTFTTSGRRDGTSADIADYNSFVQAAADAAPIVGSWNLEWKAIASTSSTDAVDNTNTDPAIEGIPIYRVDGTLVAPQYNRIWNREGANIIGLLNINEFGEELVQLPPAFTNGVPVFHTTGTQTGRALIPSLGNPDSNGRLPVGLADGGKSLVFNSGESLQAVSPAHFYAISEVVTVVPEPSSAAMALFVVTMGFGRFRRIVFLASTLCYE